MESEIRKYMEKLPTMCTVCKVLYNEDRTQVEDVVIVLANERFCQELGQTGKNLTGLGVRDRIIRDNPEWEKIYDTIALEQERAEGVIYSPELRHWIGYAGCMAMDDYCCMTYLLVDEYRDARVRTQRHLKTNECIVRITQTLNDGIEYDQIMHNVLEKISDVLKADRIYIFEKTDVVRETFEWCAEGVTPLIDKLQPVPVEVFGPGIDGVPEDSLLIYSPEENGPIMENEPEVFKEVRNKYTERMLSVPLKINGKTVGFLGADNYELDDEVDIERILKSVGTFIAARIANQQLLNRMDQISKRDALTGILNRLGFDSQLRRYISENESEPYVGVVIDIDNFKFLNDLLSHYAGDLALKAFATSLVDNFGDRAVVGRNGGDEFVMLFKNITAAEVAVRLEEFCAQEHYFTYEGEKYNFSISIGYAGYPDDAANSATMLQKADTALYFGKRNGRRGCYRYSKQIEEQSRMRLGFALQDIVSNMPGAFLVHQAGGDERILYANQALVSFFDCRDMDEFFEFTNCSFPGLIYPDDLKKLELKIWNQINISDSNAYEYVDYRIVTAKGRVRNVTASGHLVHNQFFGDVFYVLMLDRDGKVAQ